MIYQLSITAISTLPPILTDSLLKLCMFLVFATPIMLIAIMAYILINGDTSCKNYYKIYQSLPQNVLNAPLYIRYIEKIIDMLVMIPIIIAIIFIFLKLPPHEYFIFHIITGWLTFIIWDIEYYFFCEFLFGKTIGKWICGTLVVSEDNSRPSARMIFKRTISRLKFAEAYSFLWTKLDESGELRFRHDADSKTKVIIVR